MTFTVGEQYTIRDEEGRERRAHVIEQDGGWYLLSEDELHCWPLVSLWRWRALSHGQHWEGVACGHVGGVQVVGMGQPGAWEQVEWLMADPVMLLVDMRYAARSRWRPCWNKRQLLARWGSRYTHERGLSCDRGRARSVSLSEQERGIAGAVELLSKGYRLLLLCGCRGNEENCHCRMVVRMIGDRLQGR